MGWTVESLNSARGKRCMCLFSEMSRRAVDPIWPVQWVTATLSSGVKQLGHYAEIKNDWSCVFTCPICLHGMYRKNFTSASYIKNTF